MLLEGLEGCLIWDIPAFFSSSRLFSFIRVNSYGCLISDSHRTCFRIFLFFLFSFFFHSYFYASCLYFRLFFVFVRFAMCSYVVYFFSCAYLFLLLYVFCRGFMSCGFVSCRFVFSSLFIRFLSRVFLLFTRLAV